MVDVRGQLSVTCCTVRGQPLAGNGTATAQLRCSQKPRERQMTSIRLIALCMVASFALIAPAEAKCGHYGGWGIGITQGIASFMSDKATHQAMDKDSAKPVAALKTECNTNAVLVVQCHTTTKACSK
jgi:hypothetical protein